MLRIALAFYIIGMLPTWSDNRLQIRKDRLLYLVILTWPMFYFCVGIALLFHRRKK